MKELSKICEETRKKYQSIKNVLNQFYCTQKTIDPNAMTPHCTREGHLFSISFLLLYSSQEGVASFAAETRQNEIGNFDFHFLNSKFEGFVSLKNAQLKIVKVLFIIVVIFLPVFSTFPHESLVIGLKVYLSDATLVV